MVSTAKVTRVATEHSLNLLRSARAQRETARRMARSAHEMADDAVTMAADALAFQDRAENTYRRGAAQRIRMRRDATSTPGADRDGPEAPEDDAAWPAEGD
jgi:hypothetical protein